MQERLAYYFGSVHPLPPPTIKAERGAEFYYFITKVGLGFDQQQRSHLSLAAGHPLPVSPKLTRWRVLPVNQSFCASRQGR